MKVFAISDLHISTTTNKPMDIFGSRWKNYMEKIREDWCKKVTEEDIVLIAGDLSWAMKLDEFQKDISLIADLPGQKVFIKGNHDYWFSGLAKVNSILPDGMTAIYNTATRIGNYVICGTRGWSLEDQSEEGKKMYRRETLRLELTLKEMQKLRQEGDKVICMLHYPPFTIKKENNDFLDLIDSYKIDKVIYGHLHGDACKKDLKITIKNCDFYLTSCDIIDNKLVEIY